MIIYKIENKINGKIYIGQTTVGLQERIKGHKYSNYYVGRAIKEYGIENFAIDVVEECKTLDELNEREMFWIAYYNCKVPNGYNLTDGGEGTPGRPTSAETRAKISKSLTGKHHSEESRQNMSKASKGHPKSIEMRKKLSATNKGKKPTAAIEARKGCHHSDDTKKKLSALKKGKKRSSEIRKRISDGHKGHSVSQETRDKISKANTGHEVSQELKEKLAAIHSKKVRCLETGEIFQSIKAAAEFYHIHGTSIIYVCKGKQHRAGGLHWEYLND